MLTDLQKRAAQAIINVFETGNPRGEYGRVTLLANDTGHLTYGRSQTTLASGNLHLLIKAYCEADDAQLADELTSYLKPLSGRDFELDHDTAFRGLLKQAGDDPTMHEVQDQFFDRVYWTPSVAKAAAAGVTSGLGIGVVYDSFIHGSWDRMRIRTNERRGPMGEIGENEWIAGYVRERREWLATHDNALLHRTVYRMEAFRQLMDEGKWDLALPFLVRGILIDENVLDVVPVRVSAEDKPQRTLFLIKPTMKGDDVRAVQQALAKAGFAVTVDGTFGAETGKMVKQFQKRRGLKDDGIVGPATRTALDL